MESSIVKDFQNLQVISHKELRRMDALVNDLANALEETSKMTKSLSGDNLSVTPPVRRYSKKRRGRKRLNKKYQAFSEASESSLDEALKGYMGNMLAYSDSDDLLAVKRLTAVSLPLVNNHVSFESDSFTENFSPIRVHRRRRKCKRMAIDVSSDHPGLAGPSIIVDDGTLTKKSKSKTKNTSDLDLCDSDTNDSKPNDDTQTQVQHVTLGKRKRRMKMASSFDNSDVVANQDENSNASVLSNCRMETSSVMGESSSSWSSCESVHSDIGSYTNDDAREGDDEQSDFFHESGPACGIAKVIPWWEKSENAEKEKPDPEFEQILTGSFGTMSCAALRNFKSRVNKMMGTHGREIRSGRRRIKDQLKGGCYGSKYQQDRLQWSDASNSKFPQWPSNGNGSNTSVDIKRRRKTPPSSPVNVKEGPVGLNADPIPDTNIGNQMLQNMGWTPGSGLGATGEGITTPVQAYMRPRRQGLGVKKPSSN
ncbi:unnamed protein product [Owenia fusiformis]|uniref:G-patch domain-containing protein n=1 Tax=Owenia fusiformis TaxID=6347 RepID=A0A8S4PFI6_OWEFU|nr:unnamed protein product [Owenia fusiformis]